MKKTTRFAVLTALALVCVASLCAVLLPVGTGAQADGLYSQNFENYDGSTAANSWVWNNAGLINDSAYGPEKLINDEYAIDGWSIKVGSTSAGTPSMTALLAFQGGQLPNDGGKYWLKLDARFVGVSQFGFRFLEANTDAVLSVASIDDIGAIADKGVNYKSEKHDDEQGGYYTIWLSLSGTPADGRATWGGFTATMTGDNGGYVVIDNIEVVANTDNDKVTERDLADYTWGANFANYDGKMATDAYVWNNVGFACDAESKSMIYSTTDPMAIDGWSIKIGKSAEGHVESNNFLCFKSDVLPTDGKPFELTFDVRFDNITKFGFVYLLGGADSILSRVDIDVSDVQKATYSGKYYQATQNENGYFTISVDMIGDSGSKNTWGYFYADYGQNGGNVVLDNIAYKPSTRDYSRTVSLNETFENYSGGTAAEYVWNNSHLYCDAPDAKIEQAFDGNALVVRQATAATIADGTFIGLKGAGSDPTNVGGYYEIAFDMQTTNVVNFGLKVKAVHPENGDVDQATITVNPTTQTYSADCYAKVEFVGNNVAHVAIQFAAVGTEIFGGFFATTDNNAVLALDNYTITSIKNPSLPLIVTETGFETGELSPFTVETRFNSNNQFLGMLTVDPDKVINGALSVYAGFDATNLTDKWGKLLGLDFQFEKGTYAIQFRYKVHAASENYFYLEVGGSSGKYVRFNGNEVVEASQGVNASVEAEADNVKVLKAVITLDQASSGLLIGSFGGGFLSIDDMSVGKGSTFADLPLVERKTLTVGTKLFEENFENQNVGDNLEVFKYTSGVDAFGYEYAYSAIDGKISLVMFNGGDWSEVVKTKVGLMQNGKVYTLVFRYKKLVDDVADEVSNVNVMINNGQTNAKYIAFSTDGKVCAFTTAGGGFWKDISLASVKEGNGCFEASVTFVATENARIVLGQYGSAKIALDNIALFEGFVGEFASAATTVDAPDKNALLKTLENAKSLDGTVYTAESFATLTEKIAAAESVYDNLDATAQQVETALTELEQAIDGLVEKETAARNAFAQAVAEIANAKTKAEMFDKINVAINAYKQVTDKAAVAEDYAKLQAAVGLYNEYVTTVNTEVTTANDVATKVFVTAGGVTAVLACVYVAIKKLLGGAL